MDRSTTKLFSVEFNILRFRNAVISVDIIMKSAESMCAVAFPTDRMFKLEPRASI